MKFQVNPKVPADHITARNMVFRKKEIYDSSELRYSDQVMKRLLGLNLKGMPFFEEVKS